MRVVALLLLPFADALHHRTEQHRRFNASAFRDDVEVGDGSDEVGDQHLACDAMMAGFNKFVRILSPTAKVVENCKSKNDLVDNENCIDGLSVAAAHLADAFAQGLNEMDDIFDCMGKGDLKVHGEKRKKMECVIPILQVLTRSALVGVYGARAGFTCENKQARAKDMTQPRPVCFTLFYEGVLDAFTSVVQAYAIGKSRDFEFNDVTIFLSFARDVRAILEGYHVCTNKYASIVCPASALQTGIDGIDWAIKVSEMSTESDECMKYFVTPAEKKPKEAKEAKEAKKAKRKFH